MSSITNWAAPVLRSRVDWAMAQSVAAQPRTPAGILARWLLPVMAGAGVFGLYMRTVAPGLTFGDAGDLTIAAYQLGIPHPTGYPLYTLLGHWWIRMLPWGDPAWRMNVFSAISASLAVGVLYVVVHRLTQCWRSSFLASAMFAVSPTFWSQATTAEVYALHVLLMSLLLLVLSLWAERPTTGRALSAAVAYGLMLAHHLMAIWLLPAVLAVVLWHARTTWHKGWTAAWILGVVAPLSLYAYLPWAALRDPPWNWGDPRTPGRFAAHVTGQLYRQRMVPTTPDVVVRRVRQYLSVQDTAEYAAASQFPIAVLVFAPVGLWTLARSRRAYGTTTLLAYLAPLAWAMTYRIRDIDPYFLPCHLMTALWIGAGFHAALALLSRVAWGRSALQRTFGMLAACVALGLPLAIGTARFGGLDRSADRGANQLADAVLSSVQRDAVLVLSGDSWGFPVAYRRYVLGQRPDVVLLFYRDFLSTEYYRLVTRERRRGIIVPRPPRTGDGLPWLNDIFEANLGRRPCYLAGDAFDDPASHPAIAAVLRRSRRIAPGLPVYRVLHP